MITVIRFFYILVTHNLIIPKKWLHSLNSEYATFFTVFYFVTASNSFNTFLMIVIAASTCSLVIISGGKKRNT